MDQNPEASVFGHRSSNRSSKENKATGMIADNQIFNKNLETANYEILYSSNFPGNHPITINSKP